MKQSHIAAIVTALGLLVSLIAYTIASSPLQGTYEVRPLSDVYGDGPPTVTDINPTHVTLNFTSSIPLACSIVYGTNDSYGQIATDPDMAGAAIIEHNPIMGGLTPETAYQFRIQGADANGIIYVSDVFTFTTPTADNSDEINVGALSAGAEILDVSSNFGGGNNSSGWGANKAIDENASTAWATNGDGNGAYLTVQLSQPSQPHAVSVWSREMTDTSSRVIDFTLTSDTNETFGPFTLPDAEQAYRFETPFTAPITAVTLDVLTSTGGNTGLIDFAIYAPADNATYLPLLSIPVTP